MKKLLKNKKSTIAPVTPVADVNPVTTNTAVPQGGLLSLIKNRFSSATAVPGVTVLRGQVKTISKTTSTLKTNVKNLLSHIFPILNHPYFKYFSIMFKWLVRGWALFNFAIACWFLYYNGLFPTMWGVWYFLYNQIGVIFDAYWDGVAKFLDYCNKVISGGTSGVPHVRPTNYDFSKYQETRSQLKKAIKVIGDLSPTPADTPLEPHWYDFMRDATPSRSAWLEYWDMAKPYLFYAGVTVGVVVVVGTGLFFMDPIKDGVVYAAVGVKNGIVYAATTSKDWIVSWFSGGGRGGAAAPASPANSERTLSDNNPVYSPISEPASLDGMMEATLNARREFRLSRPGHTQGEMYEYMRIYRNTGLVAAREFASGLEPANVGTPSAPVLDTGHGRTPSQQATRLTELLTPTHSPVAPAQIPLPSEMDTNREWSTPSNSNGHQTVPATPNMVVTQPSTPSIGSNNALGITNSPTTPVAYPQPAGEGFEGLQQTVNRSPILSGLNLNETNPFGTVPPQTAPAPDITTSGIEDIGSIFE